MGAEPDEKVRRIDRAVIAARERRGWTREALAFHSGLSWSAIAQIESGRRTELRPSSLDALATALDVSVDYLLGRSLSQHTIHLLKHRVLPYATVDDLLAAVVPWLLEGLAGGDPVLAVVQPDNGRALRRELDKPAGRFRLASSSKWYRSPLAALSSYQSFIDENLDAGASLVRVVAEPPWSWNNRSAAVTDSWTRYEALVNLTLAGARAEIVCLYNTETTPGEVLAGANETHPETVDAAGVVTPTPHYDPCGVLLR